MRQNFTNQEAEKAFGKTELSLKDLAERYTSSKGEDSNVKDTFNQLRPRYIKDVTQKDKELPMDVIIYDAFEILVPISSPELMEVSPSQPVRDVPVPRKLLIPQILPTQKVVRTG